MQGAQRPSSLSVDDRGLGFSAMTVLRCTVCIYIYRARQSGARCTLRDKALRGRKVGVQKTVFTPSSLVDESPTSFEKATIPTKSTLYPLGHEPVALNQCPSPAC